MVYQCDMLEDDKISRYVVIGYALKAHKLCTNQTVLDITSDQLTFS